ncbi:hypothetical protein LTS18_014583 [Coniosporium uncinatum]|uniref:Uncharacterized protein n=1 Tax=Coniosporium uncinatum TaxID=93489 RepID=A0ACC3CV61_9PEZI|nr:hypothetical protein LTS18_014583 [Coniosporium uncinatum]
MRHQGFLPRRGTWLYMVRKCGEEKDWRAWWLVAEMKAEGWNTARVELWLETVWPESESRYKEMMREGYRRGGEEKLAVESKASEKQRKEGGESGFQSVAAAVVHPMISKGQVIKAKKELVKARREAGRLARLEDAPIRGVPNSSSEEEMKWLEGQGLPP